MNFVVVGAGAWGTAFALHLTRAGHRVMLVPRRGDQAATLEARRENVDYLPGIPLPGKMHIVAESAAAFETTEVVLLACPAQALRETCTRLRPALAAATSLRAVISLAKGLEVGTHRRPSEVIVSVLGDGLVGSLS